MLTDASVRKFKSSNRAREISDGIRRMGDFEEGRVVLTWTVGKHFALPDGIVQGGLLCAIPDISQTFALFRCFDDARLSYSLHTSSPQ
jgi:acyl-coenzyme A thioesterase PaaI-like protein